MSDEKTCNCPTKSDENMFELSEEDLRHVSGGGGGVGATILYCRTCEEKVSVTFSNGVVTCDICGGHEITFGDR